MSDLIDRLRKKYEDENSTDKTVQINRQFSQRNEQVRNLINQRNQIERMAKATNPKVQINTFNNTAQDTLKAISGINNIKPVQGVNINNLSDNSSKGLLSNIPVSNTPIVGLPKTNQMKKVSMSDIKAMEEAERLNKEIEKGGYHRVNAMIGNTLKSFEGGVKKGVAGIGNAVMLPIAADLKQINETGKSLGILQDNNILEQGANGLFDEAERISNIGNYSGNVNARVNDNLTKITGNVMNVVGNMMPSIVSNVVAPGSGLAVTGVSAAGNSAQETLNDKRDNAGQALLTGVLKGTVEMLTEKLFGGNFLAKNTSIDKLVTKGISSKLKSNISQKLASKTYEYTGEIVEELLSDTAGYFIDNIVNNKELPSLKEWWENSTETARDTFLSTAVLNVFGMGGNTYQEVQDLNFNKQQEADVKKAIEKAKKQFVGEDTNTDNTTNKQNETNKTDRYRSQATKEIQNSKVSAEDKQMMQSILDDMQQVTEQDVEAIKRNIDEINKVANEQNKLPTNGNYKNDQARKQKYMQYKNDTNTYDSTIVNEVLDTVPMNRNGKRTVKQWTNAANEIGQRIADLSNEEIERIAYKSWFDVQPSKTITRYDNVNKQNVGFSRLDSDVWINNIYDGVNKARENGVTPQIQEVKLPMAERYSKNTEVNLPQNNIVVDKADNLVTSAKKYNLNYKDISIQNVQKVLDQKGINGRFDENYFNNENEGGKYILNTDDNGNVISREIVLNPKANEQTILQEMAIHELSHDIFAGNTQESQDLYKSVRDYLQKDTDFEKYKAQLAESYLKIKDQNGNYVYNREQSGFNQMVEEEAIAKTLQTKFGTQEEINRLVTTKRNIAQRFYDWIVDKIDTFKNRNDAEYLFWKDVRNKFEKAFNETKFNATESSKRLAINSIDDKRLYTYNNNSRQVDLSDLTTAGNNVARYINNEIRNNRDVTIKAIDGTDLTITKDTAYKIASRDNVKNNNGKFEPLSDELYGVKLRAGLYIDEIAKTSKQIGQPKADTKNHKFAKDGFTYRKAYYMDNDGQYYSMNLSVGINGEVNSIYNLGKIKEAEFPQVAKMPDSKTIDEAQASTNNSIPSSNENVNTTKYSMQENGNNTSADNQGRTLTKEQRNYFKDSKARSDNGQLETVYHGTNRAGFMAFNRNYNYYTNNKEVAQSYTGGTEMVDTKRLESVSDAKSWLKGITDELYINENNVYDYDGEKILSYDSKEELLKKLKRDVQKEIGNTEAGGVYEGYINITKPIVVDAKGGIWSMIDIDGITIEGVDDVKKFLEERGSSVWKEKGKFRTTPNDIAETVMDAVENGELEADGIIIKNVYDEGGYGNVTPKESGTDYITFNSNQFKAVDNKAPTSNPDIRYSVSDSQTDRVTKLNEDFDLTVETRDTLYDQRNELQKQYDEIVDSQEYKEAKQRLVKMPIKNIENTQEYKAVKIAQDIKNKINDIQDEIDVATSEIRRLSDAIDKEEKQHRSPEESIKQAKKALGLTNNFNEAGYMLQDGSLLDFSGRSQGSNAYNQRTMDHREINEFGYDMNEFIDLGNIRLQPEGNGFELMKEPTEKQYNRLKEYINKVDGEVFVDIYKNGKMGTYDAAEYKKGTSASKVISDLQYYFRNGEFPKKSKLAEFRYSLSKANEGFDEYLTKRISKEGTRTSLGELKLPTKEQTKLPTKENINKQVVIESPKEDYIKLPTSDNEKYRKHYKSILESKNTTPEAKAIAKELIGSDTYIPESNNKQLERADERITLSGADSELDSLLSRAMTGGNIKADDIAVGERLIQYYSKTGNKAKLAEAIQATAMAGTSAGQTVQAMSLLNHQTPQGQAVWLQRSVEKMNNDLKRARGEKADQFDLTPEMIEKIVNSKDKKQLAQNLNEVYAELGQQVSKTNLQKIDAWRYFSMLANPRTHIRNIVGNVAMGKVQAIKNRVAGTIEGAVSKYNPDMERTHTLKRASEEVKAFAKADIENVADRLELNENKYNPKSRLESNMRTFKSDALENTLGKMFSLNDKALAAEDGWGLKAAYTKAMSEYMTANNLTPDNITDQQLAKARNYAVDQAKEATFHQESAIATAINQFSNKNKLTKFFVDATLPFKKTPINVAKAGIEYSPIGLTKSIVYDVSQLRKGNITVNQYIDNVSKGLTGTGIALLGYALAEAGVLKVDGDDDDKESFEEDRGNQKYSIRIGDNTYKLDWLAPAGIPLFIGAKTNELMRSSKEKKSSSSDEEDWYNQAIETATDILDAFTNAVDPMTEMSMLSGLSSTLKSYDNNLFAGMGVNMAKSYVNQFVPTALGQVAKTADEYERSTSSTKTGTLPKAIDMTKNQIMNKIPGLRQMLPTKTDVWGNDQKQPENIVQRALENAVLPYTRKTVSSTKVDKELEKLYDDTGEKSVLPSSLNKNMTINKEKYTLTSKEMAEYKKQYGEESYNLLNKLITDKTYSKLTDDQKQKAVEKVYEYAKEGVKLDYAKDNKLPLAESTLTKTVNSLENKTDYFIYLALTQGMSKNAEKLDVLAEANISNNSKAAIYESDLGKDDSQYEVLKETGIDATEYIKYKAQNFTSDKEDDGTMNGKTVSGSKKTKVVDYVNQMNITYNQKLLLLGMNYSVSDSEKGKIVNYVNSLDISKEKKLNILNKISGITVYKDGRVTWK